TRSITEAILRAARAPRVLINGSAQGYYGDRGDEELTEESPPGSDFLARVCVDWELEARRASPASRVVLLRTAIVLDRACGALPRMIQPFKFFAGGPLGSGKQFWSWIHLDDWVALALLPLSDERVHGPVNLGSPHPVTNAEFTAAIGQVLHRPGWFRAPSIALRAGLGEMADALLLSSTRMKPAQALGLGYRFRYPELVPALEAVLRERQASSVRH
ncbi:MAG: TIGR01777 family protein, partial [Acidobacteria bacterium]